MKTIKKIHKMMKYAYDSLLWFNNNHIVQEVDKICKEGTEGDDQIAVYNKFGFKSSTFPFFYNRFP